MRNTKENRLRVQQANFDRLENAGWDRENYGGLVIFTQTMVHPRGTFYYLQVFRDTCSQAEVNYYYRSADDRAAAIERMKASYNRAVQYKKDRPRVQTGAAACAVAVRADLKNHWPDVKFSVRSENFAGGDAVDVNWFDGPTVDQVEKVTGKYQDGYFDGMQDMYVNCHHTDDLPRAKYVMTCREMTSATRAKFEAWARDRYDAGDTFDTHNVSNLAYRLFVHSEIKNENFEIVKTTVTGGTYRPEVFYRVKMTA